MTLPLEKRFSIFSRILDFHIWYYTFGHGVTFAAKKSKIDAKTANEVDMGKRNVDLLEGLLKNDVAAFEKKLREHLTRKRFASFAEAERFAEEKAHVFQFGSGKWRGRLNINGVKVLCYNDTRPLVLRDVAQSLYNEFPERS